MLRKSLFVVFAALAVLGATLFSGSPTALAAAPFVVTSSADLPDANPGDGICKAAKKGCTLRAAIDEANFNADSDSIYLKANTTYLLTGTLVVAHTVSIYGEDRQGTVIDGNGAATNKRVFQVAPGATLYLTDVTVRGGKSDKGGGISNLGSLVMGRVAVRDNSASSYGGGIYSEGMLLMSDTELTGNTATSAGGGIFNKATLDMYNSTLFDNDATDNHGGGLYNDSNATSRLVNSTVSGNTTGAHGGGIYNAIIGTIETYNVTLINNSANLKQIGGDGGGAYNFGGTFTLRSTMVADNRKKGGLGFVNDDCGGTFKASHSNLVESTTSCTFDDPDNYIVTGLDPDMLSLADNGGWTRTHMFNGATAGVDYGEAGVCRGPGNNALFYDQRGNTRVVDGNNTGSAVCDMGAVEYLAPDQCPVKPAKPTGLVPVNGSEFKQRVQRLQWFATDCAKTYKVTILQDSKNGNVVQTQSDIASLYHITPKLAKHHTYYWKLQACNAHGCGKAKTGTFIIK